MAKRKVYLHVGATGGPGDFIEAALLTHRDTLETLDVRCPVEHADDSFRAVLDILRTHKRWGYRRREIEGAWNAICRRVLKAKDKHPVVISQPLLDGAEPDQIDLLVDQLSGCAVHVVLVTGPETPPETAQELVQRWTRAVKKPERMHLIEADAATSREEIWRRLGEIVGFGTTSMPVTGLGEPDLTLQQALSELERLARRNRTLEAELAKLQKRNRKLKRRAA
jgi:hypothetical protein